MNYDKLISIARRAFFSRRVDLPIQNVACEIAEKEIPGFKRGDSAWNFLLCANQYRDLFMNWTPEARVALLDTFPFCLDCGRDKTSEHDIVCTCRSMTP